MINTIANTATEIGFAKLTVHPAQAILWEEYSFVFFVIIKQA
jgi:hypothetical protein